MARKKSEKPSEFNAEEIENQVKELANQGLTAEKIGLAIKQKYNIRPKTQGMKISSILKKHSMYQTPDLKNLKQQVDKLKMHLSKNQYDYKTKRILLIKEGRLNKLQKQEGK